MTERALDAADGAAKRQGISVGVLHVPTIKPFDAEAVAEFAGIGRPASSRRRTMSSSAGSASLVVETLFDAGIAKKADPHRPARPLHRMRLGADLASEATA